MEVRDEKVEASRGTVGQRVTCPHPSVPVSTLGKPTCLRVMVRVWPLEPAYGMTPTCTSLHLCTWDSSFNLFVPQFPPL